MQKNIKKVGGRRRYSVDELRNMVRGAIAQLRTPSTPEHPLESWQRQQAAQSQISQALEFGRRDLLIPVRDAFEKWAEETQAEHDINSQRMGSRAENLGILPERIEPNTLEAELSRSLDILSKKDTLLQKILVQITEYREAIESGDFDIALNKIEEIEREHGVSYFSIEAKLSHVYEKFGTDELKKTARTLALHGRSLQRFFIYNFGVRNEPSQGAARFKINIKRRIESSAINQNLQAYCRFRLYGDITTTSRGVALIIAYDQYTTKIDLYFTLLRACTHILANSPAFSSAEIEAAKKTINFLQFTPSLTLERICEGALRRVLRISPAVVESNTESFITIGIASFLSTHGDGLASEDFEKAQLNRSRCLEFYGIEDAGTSQNLPALALSCLMEDVQPFSTSKSVNQILKSRLSAALESTSDDLQASEAVRALSRAKKFHRAGQMGEAIECLRSALPVETKNSVADMLLVCVAHLQLESDDREGALRTIAAAGVANERIIPILPLDNLFQNTRWKVLAEYNAKSELAICLDFYVRNSGDRKFRSYKRYSVEDLMESNGATQLSELVKPLHESGIQLELLEYFFHYVCDVYTIELLPNIGRSKAVMETRALLLRELAKLQTASDYLYIQEAQDIESQIELTDVLDVLDGSKVYVDERAITNAVNAELSADFQRYLRLVESGVGQSESLATVLQNLNSPTAKTFQIPDNEADNLFAEILSQIKEKFLFDPAAGLDIIIGRRIRHGTIASELRAPLERVGLIGQRPRVGAGYAPPDAALSITSKIDPKYKKYLFAAFARFSEAIDLQIAVLRDEMFHVTTKTKPRGIFELQLGIGALALSRSVAQSCVTIDNFSRECLSLFWYFLSLRLDTVKKTVESDLRKSLQSTFSKLVKELNSLSVNDELLAQVQQSSEELQRRAANIASWIRVPNMEADPRSYSMRQIVDVAVAVVCGQRAGFKPIVNAIVPDSMQLDAHGFSIVSDALYIAIDNISQRSGKKVDNKVNITISFDSQVSIINFLIENEITNNARTPEKIQQLERIRNNIRSKAFGDSARRDKGSGLSKLAAIVMQDRKACIDFDFTSKPGFYLKFDLVYVNSNPSTVALNGHDSLPAQEVGAL